MLLAWPRNCSLQHYYKILLPIYSHTVGIQPLHQSCDQYEEDYAVLGVASNCDAAVARDAFLCLAKRYHPDSGHVNADQAKFQLLERSYRRLLRKFSEERHNHAAAEGEYGLYYAQKKGKETPEKPVKDDSENKGFYTLKHNAPQHRQYLSYEGQGVGTPSQREKQFAKFKAMRATENVIDYKVQQLQQEYPEQGLVDREKQAARKIKTRYGMERVVEDLIQESMARGDFDNLPNAGKPLQHDNYNPYLDVATHKLNQVLIDNGYAPEWVQLEKEIRGEKEWLRETLRGQRTLLDDHPLPEEQTGKWNSFLSSLDPYLHDLNKKIDKYNLVVPVLSKQMVHFPLTRVADRVVREGVSKNHPDAAKVSSVRQPVPSSVSGAAAAIAAATSSVQVNQRRHRNQNKPQPRSKNSFEDFFNIFKS